VEKERKQYFHTQNFDFVKVARSIELNVLRLLRIFFYFLLFIFIFILYIFSHSSLEPVECKTIVVDVRCWFAWAIGNWRKEKKMRIIKASKKIKKQSPFDVKKKKTQQESLKFQFKIGKNCCHEGRSQIVFNLFFLRAEYFLMFSLSVSRF
jgi:hypothetical protein